MLFFVYKIIIHDNFRVAVLVCDFIKNVFRFYIFGVQMLPELRGKLLYKNLNKMIDYFKL